MAITFRNNCDILNFGADYYKIRDFLVELEYPTYQFGRFDWMVTHNRLDKASVPLIGVWEDGEKIVAAVAGDGDITPCFFCVAPGYDFLKKDMLLYTSRHNRVDDAFQAVIGDADTAFQSLAVDMGMRPTQHKEFDAVYPIQVDRIHYTLPERFRITSLKETWDIYQYGRVLWKGFNHERDGQGPWNPTDADLDKRRAEMIRPNVNLDLKVAVVAPDGNFVSYCGMWKDPASDIALVEPVATDPDYRMMGLGKAAVLEAIRRCGELGAKFAYVDSSQQFYYNIGFRPALTSTWWELKGGERQ